MDPIFGGSSKPIFIIPNCQNTQFVKTIITHYFFPSIYRDHKSNDYVIDSFYSEQGCLNYLGS